MKRIILTLSILLGFVGLINAQEFAMTDGSFVTCSGDFTDSGGQAADYSNNEDFTITFCSPFATDDVQATFQLWNVGVGDILLAYDGDSATGSPIGVFNQATAPGVILASPANTSGCLTFRFISNSSSVGQGWSATLACIDACQTISNTVTTTPAPDNDGVLRICQGETVSFSGTTTYSVDGSGATHEYILSDGTVVAGTTATETFAAPGIYEIDYVTFDNVGCRDRQLVDVTILVSTTPDFTGTAAADTSICFGESTTITGVVETTQFIADVAPPVTGQTFLPDGSGVAYQTCIDVTGFNPNALVQSASDLVDIFINIEHSYMGDLDITLTAPNGAQVELLNYPNSGGGRYLGNALDDGSTNPGVGFDYVFTETGGATATLDGSTGAVAFATPMPAGNYLPETPFSNLVGSSLNGLWCLDVVDNLTIDNGYIFYWGLNFNPAIIPTAGSYEPDEVVEEWVANSDITAINGSDITVTPTTAGQNCYDFQLTDSFGCTYIETICIDVAPEITSVPANIVFCQAAGNAQVDLTAQDDIIRNGLDATNYQVTYYTSDMDAAAATNPIAAPATFNVTGSTTVYARVEDLTTLCAQVETVAVIFQTVDYNPIMDLEICEDPNGTNTFDLDAQIPAILGGQAATDYVVNFFTSQADADANQNALSNTNAYTVSAVGTPDTIFVRVTSAFDQDCYATGSFNVLLRTCEVFIPEGFSPNADGTNDTFRIRNIEQFPNFELSIFNRHGVKVYETSADNYVEFEGVPNLGILAGDGLLPVGTYYYVLKFNDADAEDVASWLYINY